MKIEPLKYSAEERAAIEADGYSADEDCCGNCGKSYVIAEGHRCFRLLSELFVGAELSNDEVEELFGKKVATTGGGWSADGLVYVCAGSKWWRVGEVRSSRASWNF